MADKEKYMTYFSVYVHSREDLKKVLEFLEAAKIDHDGSLVDWGGDCDRCEAPFEAHKDGECPNQDV